MLIKRFILDTDDGYEFIVFKMIICVCASTFRVGTYLKWSDFDISIFIDRKVNLVVTFERFKLKISSNFRKHRKKQK